MATEYQIEFRAPHVIEKGVATTIDAPVFNGASAVAPSAGTVTIYDGGGTKIVDAANIAINASDIAEYEVTAASTTGEEPASDWWVEWTLTVSGETVKARNQAILAPWQIRPSVTNRLILKREPTFTKYPAGEASWQDQIEEAWDYCLNRLLQEGKNPHQITSPFSLREPLTLKSLEYIAEAQATYIAGQNRLSDKAARYREEFEAAWGHMRFDVDTDDDGDADETGESGQAVVYLSKPPAGQWWDY